VGRHWTAAQTERFERALGYAHKGVLVPGAMRQGLDAGVEGGAPATASPTRAVTFVAILEDVLRGA